MEPVIQATNILRTQIPKIQIVVQFLFCPGIVCPAEGKLLRCGMYVFLQCLSFLSHLASNSRASGNSDLLSFFVFRGYKLLRAFLKARALTEYVGDTQNIDITDLSMRKSWPISDSHKQELNANLDLEAKAAKHRNDGNNKNPEVGLQDF